MQSSVYLGANDGLYALEAYHGSLLWHYQTSQGFGPPFSPAPLFAHSTIYIVTFGGVKGKVLVRGLGDYWYQQISFLDPIKGSVIYSHNMYVEFHDFFLLDGVIYFTDYTHVYAIRLSDGAVLWSYQPGGGSDRIEVVDQIVYVFEGIYETGPMTARKATDGALLWSNQGTCGWFGGIVNGTIYLNGCPIYALHASNGTQVWSSGKAASISTVVNHIVFVKSSRGTVYALDDTNGTQLWSY